MASQQQEGEAARAEGARDFLGQQKAMLEAGFSFSGFERDHLYLNQGDGTFLDISGVSGADSISDGRGAVYADLDNDGDTDIFLRAMHGPAHFLYDNRMADGNGFLRLTLQGTRSGRDAFGAVVTVTIGDSRQSKLKAGGSGFLSQSDPRLLFGLGDAATVDSIHVAWPSGLQQTFAGVAAGRSLLLVEGRQPVAAAGESVFAWPSPRDAETALEGRLRFSRGEPLPDIPVFDLAGEKSTLRRVMPSGKPVLINFWATWCAPCAREMPELEQIWQQADGGVQVIGFSLDRPAERSRIPGFVEKTGVTYPILTSEPEAWEELFRSGDIPVPLSVLVGADGKVEALFEGWSRETRRRLLALMGAAARVKPESSPIAPSPGS